MSLVESLPNRPLKLPEVELLASADGIEEAAPIAYREEHPPTVAIVIKTNSEVNTLAWAGDVDGGWRVID